MRDARPAGWVTYWLLHYMREYNAESPKQGRKGFNSIVNTIYFSYLPITYLSMVVVQHVVSNSIFAFSVPNYSTLYSRFRCTVPSHYPSFTRAGRSRQLLRQCCKVSRSRCCAHSSFFLSFSFLTNSLRKTFATFHLLLSSVSFFLLLPLASLSVSIFLNYDIFHRL